MMQPLFPCFPLRRWRALLGAAALLPAAAGAVELGEVAVHSHIGQQLSADIELVDLTADELAELQARLARPDVFAGASIAMHPALSGMNIAVIKRDKRRLLHLTTLRPVDSELLHIFFEFSGGGRQTVRTATLWLTPDPAPARSAAAGAENGGGRPALAGNAVLAEQGGRPASPQTAGAPPRAAQSSSASPQSASLTAPQQAASRGAARQAAPPAGASPAASPAASPVTTKPAAPPPAQPQAAAPLAAQQVASVTPVSAAAKLSSTPPRSASAPAAETGATPSDAELSAALARATARRAAHAMPASAPAPAGTPAAGPGAPGLALPASVAAGKRGKPAAGQSCSPAQLDQRLKQCLALDAQNAAIASKLNDLEGKVKVLQSALAPVAAGKAVQGAAVAKVEQGAAAKTEHPPAAAQDGAAAKAAHGAAASGLASDKAGQPASATAPAPSAAQAGHAASTSPASAAATATATAKDKPEHAAPAKGEQAASAGHAVAAKGAPAASAEHASASAAASASSAPAAASAKASAASAAAHASKPAAPPEKPKQMTRSRLMTMIAGGTLALLAVIATIVHFVRKRRAKLASGPLKIWQSWRKKKPEDAAAKAEAKADELPPEPVLTDIVEHGTA